MTDERLMKQLNVRLSAVERNVKIIKDAVNNASLEEKLGRAIEGIENKVEVLGGLIYAQKEPEYYTDMEVRNNSLFIISLVVLCSLFK